MTKKGTVMADDLGAVANSLRVARRDMEVRRRLLALLDRELSPRIGREAEYQVSRRIYERLLSSIEEELPPEKVSVVLILAGEET